jgi:hypothetical protein
MTAASACFKWVDLLEGQFDKEKKDYYFMYK